MPEFFIIWLCSLNDDQAEQMWNYFDDSFTNCEDVIATIAESHRTLTKRLCGKTHQLW